MFDIHALAINNFKSWAGKHKFVFPTTPGLYFITGDNKLEPKLGSNGAGKSTLLDAIYWCLYGRSLRGLKGSDVVTWGEKSCTVIVVLACGSITRKQSPNSLELDGKPVDQAELEKHIGLGPQSFLYSVVLPQFNQSFFELTPTEKLSLFSQIMSLDAWLEYSQKAAVEAERLGREISKAEALIDSAEESISSTQAAIKELIIKDKEYIAEQKAAITSFERGMDEIEIELLESNDEQKKESRSLTALKRLRDEKAEELGSIKAAQDKHKTNREFLSIEHAKIKTALEINEDVQNKLSKLKGSQCPTCLQVVDLKHLLREQMAFGGVMAKQRALVANISQQIIEAEKFVAKTGKSLALASDALAVMDHEIYKANNFNAKLAAHAESLGQEINQLKGRILAEKKRPNIFTELISEKRSALEDLKGKLRQLEIGLASTYERHEANTFWVSGFKRLRLHLIEETLRSLEMEVNNSLATLGLLDWQVEFDIERENKSGGLTKGFVVFVRNATHPEPVKFEAWSGGEGQRLQLAGDLGLANLIMLQAGLHNTIEFYDEPSKHLSQEGLLDLAETLHQRAVADGKRIFLIDHRTIDFGDFADTIKIVKTEEGSSFKKEGAAD